MKGQETISIVLITGILLGLVGSVYLWGVPLIEKNTDVSRLESAEEFMNNLNEKIKNVATHGGREQVRIPLGRVYFDSNIDLSVETKNTIYDSGAWISIGKNECTKDVGVWGVDDQDVLCVLSEEIGEEYDTGYRLRYINLTLISGAARLTSIPGSHGRRTQSQSSSPAPRGLQLSVPISSPPGASWISTPP